MLHNIFVLNEKIDFWGEKKTSCDSSLAIYMKF